MEIYGEAGAVLIGTGGNRLLFPYGLPECRNQERNVRRRHSESGLKEKGLVPAARMLGGENSPGSSTHQSDKFSAFGKCTGQPRLEHGIFGRGIVPAVEA